MNLLAAAMMEDELQTNVEHALLVFGWRSYHTRYSIGSAPGFPDLIAVRGDRVLAAELKREGKSPTRAQDAWLDDLAVAGVEVFVWYPSEWIDGTIESVLR